MTNLAGKSTIGATQLEFRGSNWEDKFKMDNTAVIDQKVAATLSLGTDDKQAAETLDPFRPENLRLSQSALHVAAAKKLLTTVPVRKPHKQDFVRVHPTEMENVALMEFEREFYLIVPAVLPELSDSEYFTATLHVAINRQKVVFLWPVRLPGLDGKQMEWHVSAAEAATRAMSNWVRMTANMDLGAYEIFEARAIISEPEWPEQTFWDLVKIAFRNRLIQDMDHPVIQKLKGLA
jgi:hypothetical protein